MTPVELSRTVLRAVRRAVDAGELDVAVPAGAGVTPPGPGGCGDYATNVALRLAGPAGLPASEVAAILLPHLGDEPGVAHVAVTGPGFLNVTLAGGASAALVSDVLTRGSRYGHGDALAGEVVELRVPYDTRAEVVADTLVRIVATQGGRAEVRHAEPVTLRPVPAPEDPAPLGADAARWALLYPASHDRPRISADHLDQREGNPLFRVRYAHARARALRRNAAALGFDAASDVRPDAGEPSSASARPAHAAVSSGTAGSGPSLSEDASATSHPSATAASSTTATPFGAVSSGAGPVAAEGAVPAPDPAPYASPAPGPVPSLGASPDPDAAASPGPVPPPAPTSAPAPDSAPAAQGVPGPDGAPTSDAVPAPMPVPAPVLDSEGSVASGLPAEAGGLLAALAEYPHALRLAAVHRAPDRLARQLVVVADGFLLFQHLVLPLGDEKPSAAHRARLALAEAAGTVLAGGLSLLGISAPEHL
ncbi:ArgS-related anticodon-binding protein NrtL [Streptomyces sp. NPDC048566]|uniref:ArgS-related anticodon-binding protein NrtL n=1 Tax=Streptomyces sp. NPDC048566 TaxID=3365569 RepID=UPI0037178AF2